MSFVVDGKSAGVCIVDVSEEAANRAKIWLDAEHPHHMPGAEWVKAAILKAYAEKCNPGGEVASHELPTDFVAPRNRLMQREELKKLGLI